MLCSHTAVPELTKKCVCVSKYCGVLECFVCKYYAVIYVILAPTCVLDLEGWRLTKLRYDQTNALRHTSSSSSLLWHTILPTESSRSASNRLAGEDHWLCNTLYLYSWYWVYWVPAFPGCHDSHATLRTGSHCTGDSPHLDSWHWHTDSADTLPDNGQKMCQELLKEGMETFLGHCLALQNLTQMNLITLSHFIDG